MSSTYNAICLSHTPPLEVCDWQANTPEEALHVAQDLHSECDVMVGRYSYPLIAVGCPRVEAHGIYHGKDIKWMDTEWLLVASLAVEVEGFNMLKALEELPGCFSISTLGKLRPLLEWRLNR